MIQEKRFGNPMTQKESFDSFYTRKLEALKIQLKEIIKDGNPYTTDEKYACQVCCGRLKLHSQGLMYCLLCTTPPTLTGALRANVETIMMGYPDVDECAKEWEALQTIQPPKLTRVRNTRAGDAELGKRIREAREARGLSLKDLASKVFKTDGKRHVSYKSIECYENGSIYPSERVLEQIKQALGMEVLPDGQ